MKSFPFLTTDQYQVVLRITASVIMALHGIARAYLGTVDDFGVFLNAKGFMIGAVIAWGITIFEIAGGIALALGYYKRIISAVFVFNLFMGIVLVHLKNGWFVVGHSLGGVEFSMLLIVCFLTIASSEKPGK
jgi:putative oxidoreductase